MSDSDMTTGANESGTRDGALWWAVGAMAVLVLLAIGACYLLMSGAMRRYDALVAEFEEMGFEQVISNSGFEVMEPVAEKKLYTAKNVKVRGECMTDLAMIAQKGELHGRVLGDFYFRGGVLTVGKDAYIGGKLDVVAKQVTLEGAVAGAVEVAHGQLIDKRPPAAVAPVTAGIPTAVAEPELPGELSVAAVAAVAEAVAGADVAAEQEEAEAVVEEAVEMVTEAVEDTVKETPPLEMDDVEEVAEIVSVETPGPEAVIDVEAVEEVVDVTVDPCDAAVDPCETVDPCGTVDVSDPCSM